MDSNSYLKYIANESINVKGHILKEGGNIFQGTADFDQKLIPDMMKQINGVMTKAGVKALPIGSGATPTPGKMSGDLDMIADAAREAAEEIDELRTKLRNIKKALDLPWKPPQKNSGK